MVFPSISHGSLGPGPGWAGACLGRFCYTRTTRDPTTAKAAAAAADAAVTAAAAAVTAVSTHSGPSAAHEIRAALRIL